MPTDTPGGRSGSFAPAAQRAELLDYGAVLVAILLIPLVLANTMGGLEPLRLVLTTLFTFFVPGRAVVTNWARIGRWSGVGMSIVFSLGILMLLATIILWAGQWRPEQLFVFEALLSLIGLAVGIVRRRKLGAESGVIEPDAVPWSAPGAVPRPNRPAADPRMDPRMGPRGNPPPNMRGNW